MISRDEWRWATVCAVALILITTLPYLIAYLTVPDDLFYTGFLTNPEDGHTYLAKIRQGWRGEWLFRLPFTPEPHQGEFLLTHYLLLGHIARWTRLPFTLILHLARVVNGFLLLLVLYYAVSWIFRDVAQRRFAFLLTALGSGLGWLVVFLGRETADLLVPEGYILYSMFSNLHFPLAIALMLLSLLWSVTPWGTTRVEWRRLVGVALCTAALGVIQPFGMLTVGVVLLVYTLWLWAQKRRLPWREIVSGIVFGCIGLPIAINGYLATTRNPVLAAWSAQNQTPSPPPWDYALGYGLVLVLALVGLWVALRRRQESDAFLTSWALSTVVLLYIPYSLQRRLLLGFIVPLGALATVGWYALPVRQRLREVWVWAVASLTHLFLIGMSIMMILTHHETLYMTRDEQDALQWLADSAPQDALVVAAPKTGMYIPAWAGQRVFYGHQFETVDADLRREQMEAFFKGGDRTLPYPPDYVFYGPRERGLQKGDWQPDAGWGIVYRQGAVTIYAVPQE